MNEVWKKQIIFVMKPNYRLFSYRNLAIWNKKVENEKQMGKLKPNYELNQEWEG